MDLLYPCQTCGHNFEDHLMGLRCAICWFDAGYDARHICIKFIGDNLKYLEDKLDDRPS